MNSARTRFPIKTGIPILLAAGVSFLLPLAVGLAVWSLIPFIIMNLLIAGWLVIYYRLKIGLLFLMAFAMPFSVEVYLLKGSMIRIPGEPLTLLAAAILLLEVIRSPLHFLKDPLSKEFYWVLPFAFSFLLAAIFSDMLLVSAKFSFINLLYMAVFLVFMARELRKDSTLFIRLLFVYSLGFVLAFLWSIYQFWQFEWNPVTIRGVFRPFFNDHTIFGAVGAILFGVWGGLAVRRSSPGARLIHLILVAVFVSALFFSTSRAAILSIAVFVLVYLVLKLNLSLKVIGAFTLIAGLILVANYGHIAERIRRNTTLSYDSHATLVERTRSVTNVTTDTSNIERLNRWIAAIRMFMERPVTGFGPGTYQFAYIPFQEERFFNRLTVKDPFNPPEGSGGTAHSEYLLALSEMGIIGFAGWMLILGRLVVIGFRNSQGHPNRPLIIIALAALSTYYFHAHFNNFLNTDKFAFLFWGTIAWIFALLHPVKPASDQSLTKQET